jgi:hypothetical protein
MYSAGYTGNRLVWEESDEIFFWIRD